MSKETSGLDRSGLEVKMLLRIWPASTPTTFTRTRIPTRARTCVPTSARTRTPTRARTGTRACIRAGTGTRVRVRARVRTPWRRTWYCSGAHACQIARGGARRSAPAYRL